MTVSSDATRKASNDLRSIGEALRRVSRSLHEQTPRLERAVEGTYANDVSDPRVQLLTGALNVSRMADVELSRLNQSLQRVAGDLQGPLSPTSSSETTQTGSFDREREELANSIIDLKQQRNELTKQRNELEILYEIAQTLNSTLEFDVVLRLVMDRVIEFVNAERGFLMLVNPLTNELEFSIARDKQAKTMPASAFDNAKISQKTVKNVISSHQPLLTDDAQTDDALKANESIMAYGIRSIMCAPLLVRDHCIGAVYVDSRINANLFGPRHRDMLLALCNQAAIAIDNARLFAEVNKAIQQVKEDKRYMDNIFSSIANGIITVDSSGTVTTFNQASSLILRIDPRQVIGKPYTEAFRNLPLQLGLAERFRQALEQPELHANGTFVPSAVEYPLPGRDGDVTLGLYMSSLRDTQGAHIGAALVIDDRTELKRAQVRAKEIRRIFERYVHPNVVQQLIKDPMALNLGGETKEISVLFADIRGYTSLSEKMAPENVMHLINGYLKIMCEAIWEEEGTLTAFQGDALMAIFNAPLLQRQHALRAVRAAWKMRLAVQEYQLNLAPEARVSFGIGVNTGLGTVGNVGAQERLQNYTAIGDVVNVASRIQNNVSDNNILLNEPTRLQVLKYVQTGQSFQLTVKNKAAPLSVCYLLGIL
ncbi:MAG TPA: adenylate/guanylate cyclase domain-containing protein [Ktedonobacteraceae bacterium]|nr:adenylate/guanylate cyclase domain-containing protein [Ktedonobacteraceae bacterium]